MIHLDDPRRPLDPALLDSRGGFAWWYVDALDAQGDGLVCIWSWGLPFLPGDRAARLRGLPPRTGDRPSVNLAVYRAGRCVSYTLYELAPESARWRDGVWTFGDCTFRWTTEGTRGRLEATLDLPVPGSLDRLHGTIEAEGTLPVPEASPGPVPAHAWTPLLGPARIRAELGVGGRPLLSYDGPGYHDRNGSPLPLDELGLDHWTWGRALVGDELVIHYLNWPVDDGAPVFLVVRIGPDGGMRVHADVVPRLEGARRSWMGMRWWRRIRVDVDGEVLEIVHAPPVDAGPFYLRARTTTRWRGREAPGWAELCAPARIDLPRHRWLVGMAVDRELAARSAWLPLFAGPRRTRWRRLVASWCAPGLALRGTSR